MTANGVPDWPMTTPEQEQIAAALAKIGGAVTHDTVEFTVKTADLGQPAKAEPTILSNQEFAASLLPYRNALYDCGKAQTRCEVAPSHDAKIGWLTERSRQNTEADTAETAILAAYDALVAKLDRLMVDNDALLGANRSLIDRERAALAEIERQTRQARHLAGSADAALAEVDRLKEVAGSYRDEADRLRGQNASLRDDIDALHAAADSTEGTFFDGSPGVVEDDNSAAEPPDPQEAPPTRPQQLRRVVGKLLETARTALDEPEFPFVLAAVAAASFAGSLAAGLIVRERR